MSRLINVIGILALACGYLGVGPPVHAGLMILPAGLEPGDQFQVAFVTSGTTTGVSSNIADYNTFVTNAAAAAGLDTIDGQAVTWDAIASTPTVNADVNAAQTAPVYDVQDQLITPNPGGLWNTQPLFLDHPIDITESGNQLTSGYVWTGSNASGMGIFGFTLGSTKDLAYVGDLTSIFPAWLAIAYEGSSDQFHVYALSSIILVPDPVPEPSSLQLGVLGLVSLLVYWIRGRCLASTRALRAHVDWSRSG